MRTLKQLFLLLLIIGAIFLYFRWDWVQNEVMNLRQEWTVPTINRTVETPPAATETDPTAITLFFIEMTDTDLLLRPETRIISGPLTMQKAVNQLIEGPANSNLHGTIPSGTRLLQASLENDLAVLNFSQELRANFNSGSQGEYLLVQSLMRTLAAFTNVRRVQILIEGQVVDTIGGHIAVHEPLNIRDY